jgi:hypothetical protein
MVTTKSKQNVGAVTLSADLLAKIVGQLESQGQAIAALVDTKASVKPNGTKPAAKPAFSIVREDKRRDSGQGCFLSFGGKARFIYASELAELVKAENLKVIQEFLATLK